MSALAGFGDRQWAHAVAAVLVGLLLAGGGTHQAGPVEIRSPLQPLGELVGRAGSVLLGLLPRQDAAAIMPTGSGHGG